MADVFLKLLNMSLSASWIVLAVLLLRQLLHRAPKWINCLLWGIVGLRLVMPFSMESVLSLIPSAEVIPQDITASQTPAIYSGIPAINNVINPVIAMELAPEKYVLEKLVSAVSVLWLVGIVALLLYSAFSYWRLYRQVRVSLRYRDNIYFCDDVESPFILGTFRPRIYLPSGITQEQLGHVLAHENAHLKRRDHWWKPLGFLVLTVYWFNPLLWLAYILLCRDIEQACDEKVIAGMDNAGKKSYSATLVACSVHRRMIMACPVAFGEVGIKTRIKGVLNYKKPTFWLIMVSLALCLVASVCFLTDPIPCRHDYRSEITLDATCTERGMRTYTCTKCEHSYIVPVGQLAHTFDMGIVTAEPTCTKLGTKELTCTCCGTKKTEKIDKHAHTYDEGTVVKEATCVKQGSLLRTCTGCGDKKTEIIEKTPHIPTDRTFHDAPNCTEQGYNASVCADCQTLFITEVLETNDDHDFKNMMLRAPTCSDPGEGLNVCSRCGHTESCTYELLEHNYWSYLYYEASCAWEGEIIHTCTDCGYTMSTFTPKTDTHDWRYYIGDRERCQICREIRTFENKSSRGSSSGNNNKSSDSPEDMFPVIRIEPEFDQWGRIVW